MTDINPPNIPDDLPNSEKDAITEEVKDTIIETEDEVESLVSTNDEKEEISSEESRKRKDEVYSTILSTNANVDDIPDTSAKVEIKYNPYTEMDKEKFAEEFYKRGDGFIPLPTISLKDFSSKVERMAFTHNENTEANKQMFQFYQGMYSYMPGYAGYQKTVADEKRYFVQEIELEDTALKPKQRKFKLIPNAKLEGTNAVIRINALRNQGGVFDIPLYHSGFWVTIKNPSDARLIEFEHDCMRRKVTLGFVTLGAIHSNDIVYLADLISGLFKDCLVSTTINKYEGDILDLIKIQDLQIIAWALTLSIYPNGYLYSRAISSSDEFSPEVAHGLLNLQYMMYVDKNALSASQLQHMKRGINSKPVMSVDSIKQYQDGFPNTDRKIVLDDTISIVVDSPSVTDYLESGNEWVQYCIDQTDRLLARDNVDNNRDEMISEFFRASLLMQYKHFVKTLIFTPEGGEEEVYDDRATIDEWLTTNSGDDIIRDGVLEGIKKYIDDSAVAIIGTPTVDDEKAPNERFPTLVPLEAMYVFFILATRKATKARNRRNPM